MYALTGFLLLGVGSVSFAPHAAAQTAARSPGLLIPLYIYPGSAWTAILNEKAANPSVPITIIINPGDGPGYRWSSNYDNWIVKMREAGINVLGYVYTSYGTRSTSAVEADIVAWKQMYWVNGIFLDEMPNAPGYESYYSTLTAYAHSKGFSMVYGNPGCNVGTSYIGTVDTLLVYENPGLPTMSTLVNYTSVGTPGDFALVSYGVSSITQPEVDLMSNYADGIYVTSGVLPAPYSTLPSYFDTLVSDVNTLVTTSSALTVDSVNSNGPTSGVWATVSTSGTVVDEGYTPLSFMGSTGTRYLVTVSNHQSELFNHWQDGTTNPSTTVTLSGATTLTATFSTTYSISVSSVLTSGTTLYGMRAIVSSGGAQVMKGFTPMTYVANPGGTYTICVQNYQSYTFSHWSDGTTNSCDTVSNLSKNVNLVATYDN